MAAPNIEAAHAFTTRLGGVSRGIFESLNLGLSVGDDRADVMRNYAAVCGFLGIATEDIVFSRQVHSARIRVAGRADRGALFGASACEADGIVTADAGVALAVFAGDCAPILLHDPVAGAVGAVHAGWRGTVADIAGAAVRKMAGEFGCVPSDVRAAIGPCISKCCFETGRDVAGALCAALPGAEGSCIAPCGGKGDKYMVDIKEANRLLLQRAGVRDIELSDECTSCRCDKYWSHRRTDGKRGSQAAIIILKGPLQ